MVTIIPVVSLNSRFSKLNSGGIDLLVKQNTPSRERRSICDVVLSSDDYILGGLVTDFSVIRKFREVYAVNIIRVVGNASTLEFVPDTTIPNSAALGRIKLYDKNTGAETSAGSITGFTFTCEIYGI